MPNAILSNLCQPIPTTYGHLAYKATHGASYQKGVEGFGVCAQNAQATTDIILLLVTERLTYAEQGTSGGGDFTSINTREGLHGCSKAFF